MKTRCKFEESDFVACGQMIVRESSPPDLSDVSFKASVAYKVGYNSKRGESAIVMMSLTDGMIINFANLKALVKHLNDDKIGYRPMSHEEIQAVTFHVGHRFNP